MKSRNSWLMPPGTRARASGAGDRDAVRIIVNADDLGMSEAVNDAIFEAMALGRVSSATILANGPAVEDAARRIGRFPDRSFGAHLNLTQFQPLTKNPRLAFLTGPDGAFAGRRDRLCRWSVALDQATADALVDEWVAQVQRLRQLDVPVSHIDSHNHSHLVVQLYGVLKRVQRRTGLARLRPAMNLFDGRIYSAGSLQRFKTSVRNALYRRFPDSTTPDHFTSLGAFISPAAHGGIRPGQTVEVMVHPGHPACTDETGLLLGPWQDALPWPVEFVSYNDLRLPVK
jgi:predicted glycoside hydrolase/deacetylase ChbG (UPF0249 family)